MLFLDRDQRRLVERHVNGPSRIRGAAGTGKTAIALHRAAYLAEHSTGPLLFTTFVKTLPPMLRTSYARLSPRTVDRVEFLHVHGWAAQYLRRKGIRFSQGGGEAFDRTWESRPAGTFDSLGRQYVHEEIDLIKSRGLVTLEQYLQVERHGRRLALNGEARKAIWRLVEVYNYVLSRSRTMDFNDLLALALQTLASDPQPPAYTAVICDEVQDVNLLGVRLLHRLAGGDTADGLLLVGDGQQAIYPGGFTLSEAGVNVVGRSTVLRGNYRNTAEIVAYANRVVAGGFTDLDVAVEHHDTDVPTRHGLKPVERCASTLEDHDRSLLDALRGVLGWPGVQGGDVVVVAVSARHVRPYVDLLRRNGIPAVDVALHNGSATAQVRVSTVRRVKGMEYKHVFCVRVDPLSLRLARGVDEASDAHAERLELMRRELFVALTRARDTLWVGSVGQSAVPVLALEAGYPRSPSTEANSA